MKSWSIKNMVRSKVKNAYSPTLILVTILLSVSSFLFSQTPEEEIKLPDILIFGESEKLIDTISIEERLRPYWTLHSLGKFEYQPLLTPEPLSLYEEEVTDDYDGYLSVYGGNRLTAGFRAGYYSPERPLLSLYSSIQNSELVKERTFRSFRLGWLPTHRETTFNAEMYYHAFESVCVYFSDCNCGFEVISKHEYEHYGISLSMQRNNSGSFPILINDIFIKASFNEYSQELLQGRTDRPDKMFSEDTTVNDFDFNARMTVPLSSKSSAETDNVQQGFVERLSLPLEFVLLRKSTPGINSGIRLNRLFILDYLDIRMLADSYYATPSLGFHSTLNLTRNLRLLAGNQPKIDTRSRQDFLRDNPDLILDLEKRLTKTPLAAFVTLENDRFLPLSLSYGINRYKDYLYSTTSLQIPDWHDVNAYEELAIETLYFFLKRTDLTEQQVTLSLAYNYSNLEFRNSLSYLHQSKEIPFIPEWQNNTTLGWFSGILHLRSDLEYLYGRKNLWGQQMPDVALLSLSAGTLLSPNLSAELGVFNLLGESYRKFEYFQPELIPEEPRHFRAGLVYTF